MCLGWILKRSRACDFSSTSRLVHELSKMEIGIILLSLFYVEISATQCFILSASCISGLLKILFFSRSISRFFPNLKNTIKEISWSLSKTSLGNLSPRSYIILMLFSLWLSRRNFGLGSMT